MEMINSTNAIGLMQAWLSNRNPMPIGTKFLIKGQDKTIELVASEECPKGKFVYDTGEDFDISKNVECEFIQYEEEIEEDKSSVYNESVWDELDKQLNGEADESGKLKPFKFPDGKNPDPVILKTFGSLQKGKDPHKYTLYDVTSIIDALLKAEKERPSNENKSGKSEIDKIITHLNSNYYPYFTKDKIYMLFANCEFKNTKYDDIMEITKNGKSIGYLFAEKGLYMFSPKSKTFGDEYAPQDTQTTGFYYTAESYLDIALTSIQKDEELFLKQYNNDPERNKVELGYHSSAVTKSLLAFSCECYLKSLLMNEGKTVKELKDIGHGLVRLYTALDNETMIKVFDYMERNGYKLYDPTREKDYEAIDLADKFMLDLAKDNNAFAELRYPIDNQNTNYDFLYHFALALRHCSKKEYMFSSPFGESIENKVNKK